MRRITLPNGKTALQGADTLGGKFSIAEGVSAQGLQGLLAKIKAQNSTDECSQDASPVKVKPPRS